MMDRISQTIKYCKDQPKTAKWKEKKLIIGVEQDRIRNLCQKLSYI